MGGHCRDQLRRIAGEQQRFFWGTTATAVGWSDTAIMAVVPGTLGSGQTVPVTVTTAAGTSNSADFEIDSTAAPFTVSPQQINLLVGQTRTITVTDSSGNPVTGLEWTTSNASVVSLSSDDPPVLTAVAPGTAIVYVVGMPILVTVYSGTSLPAGTSIWSVPIGNGSSSPGSITMAPAVPSSSGVDLITLDNSFTLTGLSADGSKVWKVTTGTTYGGVLATSVIPDFSGSALLKPIYGFISNSQAHWTHKVQQVNSLTGAVTDLYTFSSDSCWLGICDDSVSTETVIPHPSGALMIQDNVNISVIDPTGVQATTTVALDNSTVTTTDADGTQSTVTYAPQVGKMIVAGDGNAYVPYYYYTESDTQTASEMDAQRSGYLMALVVAPNGGSNKVQLNYGMLEKTLAHRVCETASGTDFAIPNGGVITNADQGAAVFADVLQYTAGSCTYSTAQTVQMNFVSQAGPGSQVNLTGVNAFVRALQREDGSYIGTDGADNVITLAQSGSVVWRYALPAQAFPQYATADGGAIVTTTKPTCPPGDITEFDGCQESSEFTPFQSGYGQLGTQYTFDTNGNVTSQTPDPGAQISWTGQWFDPPPFGNMVSALLAAIPNYAESFVATAGGSPGPSGAAVKASAAAYRKAIIAKALAYLNSTKWTDYVDLTGTIHYLCNYFVGTVLYEADPKAPQPLVNVPATNTSPATTRTPEPSEWAGPNDTLGGCWRRLKDLSGSPPPVGGDVVAQRIPYHDATGHVAIVAQVNPGNPPTGSSVAATTDRYVLQGAPGGTVKEYDFGFRPNTVDGGPNGWHVGEVGHVTFRRFTCYADPPEPLGPQENPFQ